MSIMLLSEFDAITFSVLFKKVKGSLPKLFVKEHCQANKELNISAFLKEIFYVPTLVT